MSHSVSPRAPVSAGRSARSPVFSVVVGMADPLAAGEAIAGLRQQTLTAWEAIAFRDPQDSSVGEDWADRGGEGRVRWLEPLASAGGAGGISAYDLNRAIAIARGSWVVVLGVGDRLATVDTLERMGESLGNPSWDGCLTHWTWRSGDRVVRRDDGPWGATPGIGVRPDRPWGTVWLARSALVRLGGFDESRGASALADGVQRLVADGGRLGQLRRSPLVADPMAVRAPLADPGVVLEFESVWMRSQPGPIPPANPEVNPEANPGAMALPYLHLAWGQAQGGHAIAAAQTLARARDRQSCPCPHPPAIAQWVEIFQRLAQEDGIRDIDAAIALFPWPLAPSPSQAPTAHHRPLGFVLYRILGNDLPPRHQVGQTLNNLRFILRHEPPLEGCEKRWVVNRIVDHGLEAAILAELERHGQPYLHLPFDEAVYATLPFSFDGFAEPNFFRSRAFSTLTPFSRNLAIHHAYHFKNQYVMHNNGGRNGALREGRSRGRWILPWDGNCFLTTAAWRAIRATIAQVDTADGDGCQYAIVPMARLASNDQLLDPHFIPAPVEEPQIAFRYDAQEIFDPERRYGRMPKVELLRRLQIPGPWDGWSWYPWEKPALPPVPAGDRAVVGGWVVRLASGNPHSEADADRRWVDRGQGILGLLDRLDDRLTARRFQPRSPLLPDLWERLGDAFGALAIPDRPEPWPAFPPGHGIAWVRFQDGVLCDGATPEAIAAIADLPRLLQQLQGEEEALAAAADLGAAGSAWVVQVAAIALYLGEFKTARWTLATGILTRPFPAAPVDGAEGDRVGEMNFWDGVDRLVAVRLGQRMGLDLWTAQGWGGRAIAAAAMEWIQGLRRQAQGSPALGDRVALVEHLITPLRNP